MLIKSSLRHNVRRFNMEKKLCLNVFIFVCFLLTNNGNHPLYLLAHDEEFSNLVDYRCCRHQLMFVDQVRLLLVLVALLLVLLLVQADQIWLLVVYFRSQWYFHQIRQIHLLDHLRLQILRIYQLYVRMDWPDECT